MTLKWTRQKSDHRREQKRFSTTIALLYTILNGYNMFTSVSYIFIRWLQLKSIYNGLSIIQ